LLEGKDLVPLGFGGNAGAEAFFAGEVGDTIPSNKQKELIAACLLGLTGTLSQHGRSSTE